MCRTGGLKGGRDMRGILMEQLRKLTSQEEQRLASGQSEQTSPSTGSDFTIDSGKLLAQGQLIALRPHARFIPFPEHTHDYVEILYMCEGSTRHSVNGGPALTLREGELLILNRHTRHQVEQAGEGDIVAGFIVLPQFFDYALQMAGPGNVLAGFLLDALRRGDRTVSFLHFKAAEQGAVQNLMDNLLESLVFPGRSDGRISQATLGLLLLQLLEDPDVLEVTGNIGPVLAALREIEENYRGADLTRLAGELHVSLPYLSHAVSSATGKTFKELLLEKRLDRAMALLEGTALPVDEIIEAVGYDNSSYFYRKFRERYGISPKARRKQAARRG